MDASKVHNGPLVSVCCITYNHARYIGQAIDSFLTQQGSFPLEILVHDDASTDGTTQIILEYASKYSGIVRPIIQTENQYSKGGLILLRYVLPMARGKYVAICEGDDYWTDTTKLKKQVQYLEQNPECVITYTDCQPFDDTGPLEIDYGGARRDVSSEELKRGIPIHTLTACFRNVIKEVPQDLMSARLGDQVIWSLLGAHGKGKYLTDIAPAAYRVHQGGVHSIRPQKQKLEATLITVNALYAYYSRLRDIDTARYFQEFSFRLTRKAIGWKRLVAITLRAVIGRLAGNRV